MTRTGAGAFCPRACNAFRRIWSTKPQENFGRELMELFSMGVRYYTEADVYAAARVFTGWNLRRTTTSRDDLYPRYEFAYNASAHDTSAKTFSFPIYADGSRTIPGRSSDAGIQDGTDLIAAVTSHPETARRLARRLYGFFVSELSPPSDAFVQALADTYLQSGQSLLALMTRMLRSSEFRSDANYYTRYSWPVEVVARAIKETGWVGYSLNDAVNHLVSMGQQLFEPPDVAGWELVLFLAGGNDALSTLVPYADPFYYSRRPTIAVPAGQVLQIGRDSGGNEPGLHPQLPGFRALFDQGRLALIQRTGYGNSSRSHFTGTDIWGTAIPSNPQTTGWLGRYLDTLPEPVDPLVAWSAIREVPRALLSRNLSVPAIPSVTTYTYNSPNSGAEAALERTIAQRIASHVPVNQPHLAFVNASITAAMATIDRVAVVAKHTPAVTYPNTGLASALKAVAGAIAKQVGTRIFWVQTGGFDTHASQVGTAGAYPRLMTDLNDAVAAFYSDLNGQGLMGQTLVVGFSEFGRRVFENGSLGSDHGAGGLMFALGGGVRGGLYGSAASLNPDPKNPTLENNGGDVRHETDFRSVYARVFDTWLGVNSVPLLSGDFRKPSLDFIQAGRPAARCGPGSGGRDGAPVPGSVRGT